MRDILPQDESIWHWVIGTCQRIARAYGFSKIETPILEQTELFRRSVGQETDIVKKEMFSFHDQGGEALSLRPEMTASICRAYIEHGLLNQPKPLKLFQTGPCFRFERPQSGRLRQFHQFNVEIMGLAAPEADAEAIALAYVILRELGLDVVMQVNSIGTPESRYAYIKKLKSYYQPKSRYLCQDCKQRLRTNPLRLLDCKKKKCGEYIIEAPQIIDHLDEDSKDHLMKTLEYLDAFDLPYVLNPRIVRGLDYYNRTAFEVWLKDDEAGKASALGGGGRYDGLIAQLGGRETPALGFALGIERIIAKIREKKVIVPPKSSPDIFLAHLGQEPRKRVFAIFEDLRSKGYNITFNLSRNSLKQQLESANKLKVKVALILGEKEVADDEILIKEMDIGVQESVPFGRLEQELKKRLK
jgi:histidyl-tRNA synthetase